MENVILGAYVETSEDEAAQLVTDKQKLTLVDSNEEDDHETSYDPYQIVHYRKNFKIEIKCTKEDKEKEQEKKEKEGKKVQKLIEHIEDL